MGGTWTPPEVQARIAGALRMGCTQSETARRFGISRDRVRYVAKKRGIAVNDDASRRAMSSRFAAHICRECGSRVRSHYGDA